MVRHADKEWKGVGTRCGEYAYDLDNQYVVGVKYPERLLVRLRGYDIDRFLHGPDLPDLFCMYRVALKCRRRHISEELHVELNQQG